MIKSMGLLGEGADVYEQGMERIYEIKHRQAHVPLAICVADVEDVARYGSARHLPDGLLGALLPGAVTVILARRPDAALCPALNPGLTSIGDLHTLYNIATALYIIVLEQV